MANEMFSDFTETPLEIAVGLSGGDNAKETLPKVYVALLSQTGTDAPVATVLKNTLGFIPTFAYSGQGQYTINSSAGFTANKTWVNTPNTVNDGDPFSTGYIIQCAIASTSQIVLTCSNIVSGGADGVINNTPIEIRVYP